MGSRSHSMAVARSVVSFIVGAEPTKPGGLDPYDEGASRAGGSRAGGSVSGGYDGSVVGKTPSKVRIAPAPGGEFIVSPTSILSASSKFGASGAGTVPPVHGDDERTLTHPKLVSVFGASEALPAGPAPAELVTEDAHKIGARS